MLARSSTQEELKAQTTAAVSLCVAALPSFQQSNSLSNYMLQKSYTNQIASSKIGITVICQESMLLAFPGVACTMWAVLQTSTPVLCLLEFYHYTSGSVCEGGRIRSAFAIACRWKANRADPSCLCAIVEFMKELAKIAH